MSTSEEDLKKEIELLRDANVKDGREMLKMDRTIKYLNSQNEHLNKLLDDREEELKKAKATIVNKHFLYLKEYDVFINVNYIVSISSDVDKTQVTFSMSNGDEYSVEDKSCLEMIKEMKGNVLNQVVKEKIVKKQDIIKPYFETLKNKMRERDEDNGGEPLNAVDTGYHLAVGHMIKEIDELLK